MGPGYCQELHPDLLLSAAAFPKNMFENFGVYCAISDTTSVFTFSRRLETARFSQKLAASERKGMPQFGLS